MNLGVDSGMPCGVPLRWREALKGLHQPQFPRKHATVVQGGIRQLAASVVSMSHIDEVELGIRYPQFRHEGFANLKRPSLLYSSGWSLHHYIIIKPVGCNTSCISYSHLLQKLGSVPSSGVKLAREKVPVRFRCPNKMDMEIQVPSARKRTFPPTLIIPVVLSIWSISSLVLVLLFRNLFNVLWYRN